MKVILRVEVPDDYRRAVYWKNRSGRGMATRDELRAYLLRLLKQPRSKLRDEIREV